MKEVMEEDEVDFRTAEAGDDEGPRDRHDAVYWFAYFTGLVILLPWNILITVNTYWDYKFRDVSLDGQETDPDVSEPTCGLQAFVVAAGGTVVVAATVA